QFDADGQHLPQYIQPMIDRMEKTGADIVIGSRFITVKKPKSMRMVGSYLISWAMTLTTGERICDPTSGMRLFNKKMIEEFSFDANFAPEPDTISFLLRNGAKISEVQVEMGERIAGESYLNPVNAVKYMTRMGISIIIIQWFRKRKEGQS
ncbi:MAG: glycosyltransferase, partial [Oscillospiraceae bacterium]